jgi:hypothetical protein
VTAVDGSLQSRYAHGVGPEPHSYRMPSPDLAAGDAILVGTGAADGDVEAVVTGVDAGPGTATWESITGQLRGTADMVTRPRAAEYELEAGA